MAEPAPLRDPVAVEYVDQVIADWNGELAFCDDALARLAASPYDVMDLLSVINDGATIALEKEDPHETLFERFGGIDDGTRIRVTIAYNPHLRGLTVVGFSKP